MNLVMYLMEMVTPTLFSVHQYLIPINSGGNLILKFCALRGEPFLNLGEMRGKPKVLKRGLVKGKL